MGYYSFILIAKNPVAIENPLVLLDRGVNVITSVVDDLEAFLARLKTEGVKVEKVNRLDGLEPVPMDSMLLPGETASALTPLLK